MNKYHYYVQITTTYKETRDDGSIYFYNEKNYVTEIDKKNKTARWTAGEKPLEMTKTEAISIAEGLIMNFFNAQMVTAFWKLGVNDNLEREAKEISEGEKNND